MDASLSRSDDAGDDDNGGGTIDYAPALSLSHSLSHLSLLHTHTHISLYPTLRLISLSKPVPVSVQTVRLSLSFFSTLHDSIVWVQFTFTTFMCRSKQRYYVYFLSMLCFTIISFYPIFVVFPIESTYLYVFNHLDVRAYRISLFVCTYSNPVCPYFFSTPAPVFTMRCALWGIPREVVFLG